MSTVRLGTGWLLTAVARTVLTAVAALTLSSVTPLAFGWSSWLVMSNSMAPAVNAGDIVVSAPMDRPRPGTVLVFDDVSRPGRVVVHRLVTDEGGLTTKGDANPTPDPTRVDPGDVHGMARLRIPYLGLPVYWLRTGQWGGAAAVAVGAVLLLAGARIGRL